MVGINQVLAAASAVTLASFGLVKTEIGNQIQRDVFGQAYKTGKSSVTNCYNCLTTEGKTSDKYIGALELVTSEIWTGMNSDLRSDFLSRGFPILNVSTINPEKNAAIIKAWTYEAVNCNRVYTQCFNERALCNQKLPSALTETTIAQKEIIEDSKKFKAQIDPLLVREGQCYELEKIKEENKRLVSIEILYSKQETKIEYLEKELNQTKIFAEKELNQTKLNYKERIDNLNKTYIDDLKKMTERMEKYKKLYEDAVWFPVKEGL